MDTFNFSFFDDKPKAAGEKPDETSEEGAATSVPHPTPVEADPDPFGFDEFTPQENSSATEVALSESKFSLDLPPGSSPEPQAHRDDEGLPDFALVRSVSKGIEPDLEFPDFDSPEPIDPETLFASSDLDFNAPVAQGEFAPGDDFDLDLPPTLPVEPDEIRASVEPMVFISPAPTSPVPSVECDILSDGLAPIEPVAATHSHTLADDLAPIEAATSVDDDDDIVVDDLLPIESVVSDPSFAPAPVRPAPGKPARFLTADDPYREDHPPRQIIKMKILGASGIGKNHARWFAKHSCDVVSFLGSNDESVDLTRSHLEAHMGFSGQGFSDLSQLLSQTQPQAVCIASPSPLHYAQAMQCLEAGVHVLCEKPLVYSPARTNRENLDGARELLKSAAKRNLVLATQLQYGAATPIACRLAGVSPFEVGDFVMEIETTNPKAPRDPKELWIELAPHPLSVAQYLAGEGAHVVEGTVQMLTSRSAHATEIASRFGVQCEGGRLLMCRAIVRWFDKIVDNREPRRRFAFNGRVVQYSGVKSPDGTYIAQYVAPDGYISHYSDPVDYLVGNFVRTCWNEDELLLSAEQGVQNLDWLLSTADQL